MTPRQELALRLERRRSAVQLESIDWLLDRPARRDMSQCYNHIEKLCFRPMSMDEQHEGRMIVDDGPTREEVNERYQEMNKL